MKKTIDISLILFAYIMSLSIFFIIPIKFNSLFVSLFRIASMVGIFAYFLYITIKNGTKINKKYCCLLGVYLLFQILVTLINDGIANISKSTLMLMFYPSLCIVTFMILNKKTELNPQKLNQFCEYIAYFNLFACLYNLVINFKSIPKLLTLSSSYDVNFSSFLLNRNSFGFLLLIGVVAVTILITNNKEKNTKWYLALVIFGINLFFTFSRGALISVIIFLGLYFFKNKTKIDKKIVLYIGIFLGIVFLIPFTRNFVLDNVIRLSSGLTNRLTIFSYCFEYLFKNNIILGNGYVKPYLDFATNFSYIGFHNTYFTILICQGMIGFVFHILIIYFSLKNAYNIKKYNEKLSTIFISYIITYLIYSLIESHLLFDLEYLDFISSTFIVLLPFYVLNYYKNLEIKNKDYVITANQEDLISIIVPVYNTEKYLSKCIDSILNQTYKNIEIILVNDGSTDNSKAICDAYSHRDERIKVIHKKNQGVSMARNDALENCSGKYIYFIDSDDYLEDKMLEVLYDMIINNNADLAVVGYYKDYNNSKISYVNEPEKAISIYNKKGTYKKVLKSQYVSGFLWNKLYKKELINNIKFDKKIHYREDLLFNCEYLKNIDTMVYYSNPYYHYVQRNNSALNKKKFDKKMLSHIEVLEKLAKIYEQEDKDMVYLIQHNILKACYNLLYRIHITPTKVDNKIIKEIEKTINKYYPVVINSKNLSLMSRLEIIITNKNPIFISKIKQDIIGLIKKVR